MGALSFNGNQTNNAARAQLTSIAARILSELSVSEHQRSDHRVSATDITSHIRLTPRKTQQTAPIISDCMGQIRNRVPVCTEMSRSTMNCIQKRVPKMETVFRFTVIRITFEKQSILAGVSTSIG